MCTITAGDPPLLIRWFKGNETLAESEKRKIMLLDDTTSMLSLVKLDLEDAGTYTCRANNSAGSVLYSADLRVKGTYSKKPNIILKLLHLEILYVI